MSSTFEESAAPETRAPEVSFRTVFIVLAIAVAVTNLGAGFISPLLPVYAQTMGAGGFLIGLIFSSFSVARVVFMPLAGAASDRYGRKAFIIAGLFFYALCSAGYVFAQEAWLLVAVRFFQGLGSALVFPIAMAAVADLTPVEKAGTVVGAFNAPIYLGLGLGPLLGGIMADWISIEVNFWGMGVLSLVSLLMVAMLMPRIGQRKKKSPVRIKSWGMLADAPLRAIFILRFAQSVGLGAMTAFMPLLGHMIGLSMVMLGVGVAIQILTAALLMRPLGKLADRYNRVLLSVVGSSLCMLSLVAATLVSEVIGFIAVCLMWGTSSALSVPAMTALVIARGKMLDAGMGRAMGLFNLALSAGFAVGPITMGSFYDLMKPEGAFLASAAVMLMGIVLFLASLKKLQVVARPAPEASSPPA
jgi:DHA1 family multidrug resistance protein-like MFS transporter